MNRDEWCAHAYRGMSHYALRLARDREIAEDVTQEVFLRFLRTWKPEMETWEEEQVWGWLLTIQRHYWIDRGRALSIRPQIPLEAANGGIASQNPEAVAMIHLSIREAMQRIGAKRTKLLLDYYGADLTVEEFSASMGMNPHKALARVYRARDAFRTAYRG